MKKKFYQTKNFWLGFLTGILAIFILLLPTLYGILHLL